MPKITPHVCRHTFCSNMAKSGMNPKTLQYIMGHSDISVTMNTYTHVNVVNGRFCPQSVRRFCPIIAGFNAGTYKVPACVL